MTTVVNATISKSEELMKKAGKKYEPVTYMKARGMGSCRRVKEF